MKTLPAAALGAALLVSLMHAEGLLAVAFLPAGVGAAGFRAVRAEAWPLYALVGAVSGLLVGRFLPAVVHRLRPGGPSAEARWSRAVFPHVLLIPLVAAAVLAGDRDWLSLSILGGVASIGTAIGLLPARAAAVVGLLLAGGVVSLSAVLLPEAPEQSSAEEGRPGASLDRPDVLLVVLDTVRRDRPSVYGGPVETPALERLAEQGAVFDAITASPWSVPSHVSLFTGLVPSRHGVTSEHLRIPDSVLPVAERLSRAGYETAGFSANPWVSPATGMTRGFEHWREAGASIVFESRLVLYRILGDPPFGARDKGGRELVTAFADFLRGRRADRPFFAFVNLTEAHAPYARIPRAARRASDVDTRAARRASLRILEAQHHSVALDPAAVPEALPLYDAAVGHADSLLGDLVEALESHPRGREAVVAVVSDHGELLGEHGIWGHTVGLWRPVLEVPFVLRAPGRIDPGTRPGTAVGLIDVTPTLLELAGVESETPFDGRSLLGPGSQVVPPLRPHGLSAERGVPHLLIGALRAQGRAAEADALDVARGTILRGPWRYERTSTGEETLYDLASDPDERQNLAADPSRQGLIEGLRADLDFWTRKEAREDRAPLELSEERRERLRSLGYAQ